MRKDIFRIAAAVLSFAAVSCTNDMIDNGGEVNQDGNLVPMILNSGPSVRTSLSGSAVNWTADDVVAVYDRNNQSNRFTASSVDGSNAVFEGMVAEGTTDFYAVYPYDKAVKATDSEIIVTLPSDQTPAAGTFAEEHNISIASGVKVPGEEEVSGILFMNICGLVQFTVPERLAAVSEVSFTANDKDIAGNLTVSKSDVKSVVSVSDASRTITMKGSFQAGSTFYFVVAPGEINGFSIKVVAENGAEFSKVSAKSITVAAGAVKNLGVIDFTAAPTATANHKYPNGILSGTDVTLNLGIPAGMEGYVQNLTAKMTSSEGTVVRSLSTTSAQQSMALSVANGFTYIPQGEYSLSYTYTLNGVEDTKTISLTVPAPTFNVTADAYTSYDKYLNREISSANNCGPIDIYDINCSVSISNAVLSQVGLSAWSASLVDSKNQELLGQNNGNNSSVNADLHVFYMNEHLSTTVGAYKLSASATFDGVSVQSSIDNLHVTGMPLKAAPPTQNGWTSNYQAALNNVSWNSDGVKLEGISKSTKITSSALYIPGSVNVSLAVSADLYSVTVVHIPAVPELVCRVGGNEVISKKGEKFESSFFNPSGDKTTYCDATWNGTLSAGTPDVQIENAYAMASAYVYVKSVNLLYR